VTRRRQRPGVEALEARWLLTQINEFPVPSGTGTPLSITSGPDGNLWFTDYGTDEIGMINPTTHTITEFPIPNSYYGPVELSDITTGPDGNLWFTGNNVFSGETALIGMINPTTHAITEFPIANPDAELSGITSGPDGNLWFTEFPGFSPPGLPGGPLPTPAGPSKIGMINPSTHAIAEFPTPNNARPGGITAGPDGNLGFTESLYDPTTGLYAGQIGMINPTTHAIAEFPVPTANAVPGDITAGPDGNLWFTESPGVGVGSGSVASSAQIGMINPTTHAIAEFPTPTAKAELGGIASGPDGNLWFTESPGVGVGSGSVASSAQIGMINPTTHAIAEFPTPTAKAELGGITSGPDGNLWFTESDQIGEVVIVPSIMGVVSVTHSRKEITAIILGVDEPLNPASASNRGFYSLDSGIKKRHKLVFSKPARIGTVLYDSTTDTVMLKLAKPSKGPLQVMVHRGILATNGLSSSGDFTAVVK
jgi:virginiamycin B lyase